MRWVRKYRTIYAHSTCKLCGTAYGAEADGKCRQTTCMACGTTQCMGNGLGNGTCSICYHGLLPGWSGNDRKCGYKGCEEKAVARCPRVKFCCAKHLKRALGLAIDCAILDRPKMWVEVEDT